MQVCVVQVYTGVCGTGIYRCVWYRYMQVCVVQVYIGVCGTGIYRCVWYRYIQVHCTGICRCSTAYVGMVCWYYIQIVLVEKLQTEILGLTNTIKLQDDSINSLTISLERETQLRVSTEVRHWHF